MTAADTYVHLTPPGIAKAGAVVVGYTDDRSGLAALRHATDEARLRHAQLQVIHQLIGVEVPDRMCSVRDYMAKRDRAAAHVRSAVTAAAPDLTDIYVLITTDRVADEIIVASRQAALVVLGATATHTTAAVLLEGTARQVTHGAHCPVVLVPESASGAEPKAIVCGVDRTPESIAALEWATDEAKLRRLAVHAVEVHHHEALSSIPPRLVLSRWIRDHLPGRRANVISSAEVGRPAKSLIDVTIARRGVLVIGRHDHNHWFNRSVLEAVAAQTRVPIVVVPTTQRRPNPLR